jgi:6-phosphogluconolactonase
MASGALQEVGKVTGIANPSYLTIAPNRRYLYAVSEVGETESQPGGAVVAYAIDPESGALTFLNQQLSHGVAPCHLCVDQTGQAVLVANYGSGTVAALTIQADGRLGEATTVIQHEGSSINPRRQQEPHAHSINLSPDNRYAVAADLGIDKLLIYRLDPAQGNLTPHTPPWTRVHAGAGPRHFDFHPSGRYAYLINEIDSTLTAFAYEAEQGILQELQTVPTLPADFSGQSSCADVHVAPSGRFLYGSNRGHDSIVIYAIDPETGQLSYVGHESTQGRTPRNFVIDPTGTFLLAANQNTSTVVTFRLDPETGRLNSTGHITEVPTPVCLKVLEN